MADLTAYYVDLQKKNKCQVLYTNLWGTVKLISLSYSVLNAQRLVGQDEVIFKVRTCIVIFGFMSGILLELGRLQDQEVDVWQVASD